MSDERFELLNGIITDMQDDERMYGIFEVVDKLNQQQATIEQLQKSKDVKEFSALFNQSIALKREIKDLKEENEKLQKQVESSETTMNATSNYNAFLESKIITLEKESEQLKQKLENIGLNEKNDMVKMVDGKFFIRM